MTAHDWREFFRLMSEIMRDPLGRSTVEVGQRIIDMADAHGSGGWLDDFCAAVAMARDEDELDTD